MDEHVDEGGAVPEDAEQQPERAVHLFGRGVRTALRNNATAYGFSISITAAYGLVNAVAGPAGAGQTMLFAFGAAAAFVLVGVVFTTRFRLGGLPEGERVATVSGAVDLLAVACAVGMAFGVSHVPGLFVWPVTALATVVVYLLVGGLDVLIARSVVRHTSVARDR